MMKERNGVFSATYEQSKRLFSKDNVLNGGSYANLGMIDIKSRILVLFTLGMFGGFLIFAVGQGMSGSVSQVKAYPESFHFVTKESIIWMARASLYLRPVMVLFLGAYEGMLIINLLPGKTLPVQIGFSSVLMTGIFMPLVVFSLTPWVVGLAISGMGWLGLWLQVVAALFIAVRQGLKKRRDILRRLYGGKNKPKHDVVKIYDRIYHALGPFLFLFVVLNMYVFHIGQTVSSEPNVVFIILGWAPLLAFTIIGLTLIATLPQIISNYYFVRYARQYRKGYKFTDLEWYGKGRVWFNRHVLAKKKRSRNA